MTRVVETLKGEGTLVSSIAENILTYHLEVVEETGIAPMSPGLRTIAGCVALLYSDLELSHRWKDSRYTCKMEGSCRCSAKDRDGLSRRAESKTTTEFHSFDVQRQRQTGERDKDFLRKDSGLWFGERNHQYLKACPRRWSGPSNRSHDTLAML